MNRTLVKICGNTSVDDALLAQDAGADYLGIIVDYPPSPRHVELSRAREIALRVSLPVVAVTVNQSLEQLRAIQHVLQPAVIQLHGDESPELARALKDEGLQVWAACSGDSKAVLQRASAMRAAGVDAVLLDARTVSDGRVVYGGTGHRSDWELAKRLVDEGARVVLAGGLDPDSVAEAIAAVRPWAVDVVSGVERRKGEKDPAKIQMFMAAARN